MVRKKIHSYYSEIMRRIIPAVFLVIATFMGACVPTGTVQILEEEYKNQVKNYNTSVTILPLTEDIVSTEEWNGHLVLDPKSRSLISRTNKEVYKNYYGITFSETVTGDVNNVSDRVRPELPEGVEFESKELLLSKNRMMTVLVPKSGKLYIEDIETDFSLLTQSIIWEIGYVEEQAKPVGGSTVQRVELSIKFRYVLWDNRKEQIAGYGIINESRNLTGTPSRVFYIQLFEDLSRQIVRESPLLEKFTR